MLGADTIALYRVQVVVVVVPVEVLVLELEDDELVVVVEFVLVAVVLVVLVVVVVVLEVFVVVVELVVGWSVVVLVVVAVLVLVEVLVFSASVRHGTTSKRTAERHIIVLCSFLSLSTFQLVASQTANMAPAPVSDRCRKTAQMCSKPCLGDSSGLTAIGSH
jgi:hypothetical protein